MDNRIRKSLGGQVKDLQEKASDFYAEIKKISDSDKVTEEDIKKSNELTLSYWEEACNIMFDFQGDVPDDFFEDYDNFPEGEFLVLQQLFMNPTKEM